MGGRPLLTSPLTSYKKKKNQMCVSERVQVQTKLYCALCIIFFKVLVLPLFCLDSPRDAIGLEENNAR